MKKTLVITIITLFIDQIIKAILLFFMNDGTSVTIIRNFFNISLVFNDGAAFSILTSKVTLLIIISIFVLCFLLYYIVKSKDIKRVYYTIYGFLLGGIIGNLLDRIIRGAVVDYLDFNIFGYAFPVFNFADICIVISMLFIIFDMVGDDKNEISSK